MSIEEKINIKIPKKIFGKTLIFKNIAEIENWADAELQKFKWETRTQIRAGHTVDSHLLSVFGELKNYASSLRTAISREQSIKTYADQIKKWFETNYGNGVLLSSSSVAFKYFDKLKDSQPLVAIGFLTAKIDSLRNPKLCQQPSIQGFCDLK